MKKKWGFGRPSPALIISILALFVALGGVGAMAGGALTKKKVNKIAKNQVLTLAPTLSVAKAANADKAKDADTLGGAALGSLTIGRANNGATCNPPPSSATFVDCGTVSLTLPRSGRVLINAGASWRSQGVEPNNGECRLATDGAAIANTTTRYGQDTSTFVTAEERAAVTINTVTGVLGAGAHNLTLECNSLTNDSVFADNQITAVMIGTD